MMRQLYSQTGLKFILPPWRLIHTYQTSGLNIKNTMSRAFQPQSDIYHISTSSLHSEVFASQATPTKLIQMVNRRLTDFKPATKPLPDPNTSFAPKHSVFHLTIPFEQPFQLPFGVKRALYLRRKTSAAYHLHLVVPFN